MTRRDMHGSAFRPSKPFTRACALQHGLTDKDLTSGDYHPIWWGVYISRTVVITPVVRARAALMLSPGGAVLSHHTAVRHWGGIAPDNALVHITFVGTTRPQTTGISAHVVTERPASEERRGLPITSPERTFLDMASYCGLVDLVVLGDSLVRAGVTTPDRLVSAADAWKGKRVRLVQRAAGLVRSKVRSPMETRLRLLLVLAGFPEPVIEHEFRDRRGVLVFSIDLAYPGLKLAFEFDGRHHIEREQQWDEDIIRREDLGNIEWKFVVVIGRDLLSNPSSVLARAKAAYASRGGKVPSRIPREWRTAFADARVTV